MSNSPKQYRRRPEAVTALQVRVGETSRSEILKFCPRANVGVGSRYTPHGPEFDDLDLRWLLVPAGAWAKFEEVVDGDWIVKDSRGHYEVHSELEFAMIFEGSVHAS